MNKMTMLEAKLISEIKAFLDECAVCEDDADNNAYIVNHFYEKWEDDEQIRELLVALEAQSDKRRIS